MKNLQQFLTEVGGGTKAFRYRQMQISYGAGDDILYAFKDDEGDKYLVVMSRLGDSGHGEGMSLDFTGPDDLQPTNKGLKTMFRVMTTIVDIAKEVIMILHNKAGVDIERIISSTTSAGKGERSAKARNNLYAAYARKQLGGAQVTQNPHGLVIKIPPRIYK